MIKKHLEDIQDYIEANAREICCMYRAYEELYKQLTASNPKYSRPPEYSVYDVLSDNKAAYDKLGIDNIVRLKIADIPNHNIYIGAASEYMVETSLENFKAYADKYCGNILTEKGSYVLGKAVARMVVQEDLTDMDKYLTDNHAQYSYFVAALDRIHTALERYGTEHELTLSLVVGSTEDRKRILTKIFETRLSLPELKNFLAKKPLTQDMPEPPANATDILLVGIKQVLHHLFSNPAGGRGRIERKQGDPTEYRVTPEDVKMAHALACSIYNKRSNPTGDI